MTSRTNLIYLVVGTTQDGSARRSALLSPEKAKDKAADWRSRGWQVITHRVQATCIDCEETS